MNRRTFIDDNREIIEVAMRVALRKSLKDSVSYSVVIVEEGAIAVKKTAKVSDRYTIVCSYDPDDFDDPDEILGGDSEASVKRILLSLDPVDRREFREWKSDMKNAGGYVSWEALGYMKEYYPDAYTEVRNEVIDEIVNDHFKKGYFKKEISEFVAKD